MLQSFGTLWGTVRDRFWYWLPASLVSLRVRFRYQKSEARIEPVVPAVVMWGAYARAAANRRDGGVRERAKVGDQSWGVSGQRLAAGTSHASMLVFWWARVCSAYRGGPGMVSMPADLTGVLIAGCPSAGHERWTSALRTRAPRLSRSAVLVDKKPER